MQLATTPWSLCVWQQLAHLPTALQPTALSLASPEGTRPAAPTPRTRGGALTSAAAGSARCSSAQTCSRRTAAACCSCTEPGLPQVAHTAGCCVPGELAPAVSAGDAVRLLPGSKLRQGVLSPRPRSRLLHAVAVAAADAGHGLHCSATHAWVLAAVDDGPHRSFTCCPLRLVVRAAAAPADAGKGQSCGLQYVRLLAE
jgi:hypothetical protein